MFCPKTKGPEAWEKKRAQRPSLKSKPQLQHGGGRRGAGGRGCVVVVVVGMGVLAEHCRAKANGQGTLAARGSQASL